MFAPRSADEPFAWRASRKAGADCVLRAIAKSSLPHADRFDVVAVGIEQERGVIAGAVVRAQSGPSVVATAGFETVGVEAIDGGPIGRAQRDVRAGPSVSAI